MRDRIRSKLSSVVLDSVLDDDKVRRKVDLANVEGRGLDQDLLPLLK